MIAPSCRLLVSLGLLLASAGCAGDKYAGRDWNLSGNWVPAHADPSPPPYGNALPPASPAGAPR